MSEERAKDPESYTDVYLKRKYMGGSKKPSFELSEKNIAMNKENDKTSNKPKEEPEEFSEKPKTVVSVTPNDTPEELGFSEPVKANLKPKFKFTPPPGTIPMYKTPAEMEKEAVRPKPVESKPIADDVTAIPKPSVAPEAKDLAEKIKKAKDPVTELRTIKEALARRVVSKKSNKLNFFTMLIGFSAFTVAGCAAFFSVKGIALLFSGAMVGVLIMASALEVAKLVTASFLYRYWQQLTFSLKTYLTAAVIMLIGITSLGIFGFLSDAFETTRTSVASYETEILKLEGDITRADTTLASVNTAKTIETDRSEAAINDYKDIYDEFVKRKNLEKDVIISRVATLDTDRSTLEATKGGLFSSKKQKLKTLDDQQALERVALTESVSKINSDIDAEYQVFLGKVNTYKASVLEGIKTEDKKVLTDLSSEIKTKRDNILDLKQKIRDTDIGSFKFIARSFGTDLDVVVKYFIFVLVVVFDPLAVTLVIAYNIALMNRQDPKNDA